MIGHAHCSDARTLLVLCYMLHVRSLTVYSMLSIMLDAIHCLLFLKLCQHNPPKPTGCLELLFHCLLLLLEPTKEDHLLSITVVPLLIVRYNSSQQLIFELDIFSEQDDPKLKILKIISTNFLIEVTTVNDAYSVYNVS